MFKHYLVAALTAVLLVPAIAAGADNLTLNPHLDYQNNSYQGPLIRGDNMLDTVKPGMVNYVIFYAEYCYNAKRQARTTVDLYNRYKDRVHFVVVDFNYGWSRIQNKLVVKYFAMDIPQIVILDSTGRPVFNYIGQTDEATLEKWLKAALEYPQSLAVVEHPMDHPHEEASSTATRYSPFKKILKRF